jgi:GTPase SAR1 family protein
MRHGHVFVICFSITDRRTYDEVDDWRQNVLRVKDADTFPMVRKRREA